MIFDIIWYNSLIILHRSPFPSLSANKVVNQQVMRCYTLYYTHKKARLSVFYLTIHKYSLNCKKEWWTIFFLWASLTHHSLFLSNISKFSKNSSNPRIFFNSYPTFLASWNMYLLKGETFFSPMIRWNSLFSNSSGFLHQNNHRGTLSRVDKFHTISGPLINFAQYARHLFANHICQLPPSFACPLEFVTYFSKNVFYRLIITA